MKAVMLDLETMGTRPYSAIIAIGAVVFDIEKRTIEKDFYTTVNLEDCLQHGLKVSGGTVNWWMSQSEEAREALTSSMALPLEVALQEFAMMFEFYPDMEVWGNGSDFDNVLLSCAYEVAGVPIAWNPFKNRCYRTIKNLPQHRNTKIVRVGTHHNALDDARSQALHLIQLLNPPVPA